MLTLSLASPIRNVKVEFNGDVDPSIVPSWTSTRPEVATVAPAADGLTAVVTRVAAGDTQLTVSVPGITSAPFDVSVTPPATTATIVV